ncbi:MAG: M14 family zinc carboxypeptidase, partial [Gemmatimonadales bacterium]
MNRTNAVFALLVAGTTPLSPASAQRVPLAIEYPVDVTYDAAIPTPEAVIGHVIGTRHTRPHQLVDYFRAVEASSDRIIVEQHALSYEGRPLIHAVVTSPANHARLEELRRNQLRLSDQPSGVTQGDLDSMPVVVYMGYSIHGNEASGSEAGLLLLYHLAAGRGPAVDALLDSAIIIIDPSLNPDGRGRFVDWVNGQRGGTVTRDDQDREHNEAWPGGRTNHYWFDLNRDWLPAQHPESRGRLQVFHRWRPQL